MLKSKRFEALIAAKKWRRKNPFATLPFIKLSHTSYAQKNDHNLHLAQASLLRLLADVGQDAAVHVENVAVDEVGSVGGQEHGRTLQILGGAQRAAGVLAMMNWSKG